MTHYIAIVHKDSDSAFGVIFPDLPGCFSAADEADQILANAKEALELWAEDAARLPPASDFDALRGRADICEELAAGAFLMSVPFVRNSAPSPHSVLP